MQHFMLGTLASIILYAFFFQRRPLTRAVWIWLIAPFLLGLIQGLQVETGSSADFISSRIVVFSAFCLVAAITCVPPRDNWQTQHLASAGLIFLTYLFGLAGIGFLVDPPFSLALFGLGIGCALAAAQIRTDIPQDIRLNAIAIVSFFMLAQWIELASVSTSQMFYPNAVIALQLALLLAGQVTLLWFKRDKSVAPAQANNQMLSLEDLKTWLEFNKLVKTYAHDLRQPLSTINIVSGVGKTIAESEETRQRFQHIMAAHSSFSTMLNDFFSNLKTHARTNYIFQGKIDHLMEPCDLNQIFMALQEEYKYFANAKSLTLRFLPTNFTVLTDRRALEKILRNGLDNAIKYTSEGGIVVGVRHPWTAFTEGLSIQIVDTGPGIDNDKVPNKHKGWGFGTSIVRSLSNRIQADLSIKNRPGRASGTCFNLKLPPLHSRPQASGPFPAGAVASNTPPIIYLKGLCSDSPTRAKLQLPESLHVIQRTEDKLSSAVRIDPSQPVGLFYLMIAHTASDVDTAIRMSELYAKEHKHPMCLLLAAEAKVIEECLQSDLQFIILTELKKTEDALFIPALDDLAEQQNGGQLSKATSSRVSDIPKTSSTTAA